MSSTALVPSAPSFIKPSGEPSGVLQAFSSIDTISPLWFVLGGVVVGALGMHYYSKLTSRPATEPPAHPLP